MRRSLTIVFLCCSLSIMALVPPRDPSRRAEWYAQIEAQRQSQPQHAAAYIPTATQVVGTRTIIPRVLVIMVNFSNYALISTPAEVDSMFNGSNWTKDGATGSVRQYFYDQSMGQYAPQFDIVGPVTLSKGYAEYGSGTSMVAEACGLVDNTVDFSLYDSDNNGQVDIVYVFYAGYGKNDAGYIARKDLIPDPNSLIWPQYVGNCNCGTYDGKTVTACEYSNELDGYFSTKDNLVIAGIGVPCHEYCHALGLPDLYDTKYTHDQKLLGEWDLMCEGPYNNGAHTPPSLSAYERFFLDWLTPTLITEADNLELTDIASSNQAYLISENDTHNLDGLNPNPTVFYLLENRLENTTNKGWDIGIPGEGLLITHIDYQPARWSKNTVNNTVGSFGVDLIEADGLTPVYDESNTDNGYYGKPGDAFPYGATEYTGITDHAITDITMTNGVVSFKYRGGKPVDPTDNSALVMDGHSAYKTIENGQLLIHSNGRTYSIFGIQQ